MPPSATVASGGGQLAERLGGELEKGGRCRLPVEAEARSDDFCRDETGSKGANGFEFMQQMLWPRRQNASGLLKVGRP